MLPGGRAGRAADGQAEPPLRVVIVDDHAVLRAGTRQIFTEAEGLEVVGEAADVAGALAVIDSVDPDIAIVDIRLPDGSGIDLASQLNARRPGVSVILLSAYDDTDYVLAALDAGVVGYLLKTMPGDELVRAVKTAHSGITVLDPSVASRLARRHEPAPGPEGTALTWRERQVIELVTEGLPNKVIAVRLSISARTVEGHLNRIFTKLGLTSRTELLRFALDNELVPTRAGVKSVTDPAAPSP